MGSSRSLLVIKMTTKFKPSSGSHLGSKKAQIYGERLNELSQKQGEITPPIVLADARSPKSPLHNYFEWNNTKAAEKWRLEQAGDLIRSITVEVIKDNGDKEDVRYFFSVSSENSTTSEPNAIYVSLNTIMTDADKRAEVITYAKRELQGWANRYQQYSELQDIVGFIKTHA